MTKEKILRSLENGYFMTHREQEETAQLIRTMQDKIDRALVHLQRGTELGVLEAIRILK